MKTKIRSHSDDATDFHDKKRPKVGSNQTCFAVINIDSALKKDENYYLQVFLKDSKYIEKEKKIIRHIIDDLEDFPDGSDEEYIKFKYQDNFKNVIFERAILKMHFLREQFSKFIIWVNNFESLFFERET